MGLVQIYDCPLCEGKARLKSIPAVLVIQAKPVEVKAWYYKCDRCGEEFTTTQSDEQTLR